MRRFDVRFDGRAALFNRNGERVPNFLWLVREVLGSQVTDGTTPVRAEREGGTKEPVEVGGRGGRHGHIFHAELSRVAVFAHRQDRSDRGKVGRFGQYREAVDRWMVGCRAKGTKAAGTPSDQEILDV
jgi:hypothetical protein